MSVLVQFTSYVDLKVTGNSSYVPISLGVTPVGSVLLMCQNDGRQLLTHIAPDDKWAHTLAGRYSSRLYATVNNTGIAPVTYPVFKGYFVANARVQYPFEKQWSGAIGVENLNNRRYFLFYPSRDASYMGC